MKNLTSMFRSHPFRLIGIVALIALAILGVSRFAFDGNGQAQAAGNGASVTATSTVSAAGGAGTRGGGGCCGSGSTGVPAAPVEGVAQQTGGVQKVSVDLSTGNYVPNVIKLKAGVPVEITFGRSRGCTGYVQSSDLGFEADLTGGPQTVKLAGLQPGTYGFACGMNMVTGQIVVQ
jgi:hypothetical protein